MKFVVVLLVPLISSFSSSTAQRSSAIQARYIPPPTQDKDRDCDSTGRCRGDDRYKDDDYEGRYRTENDKIRPPILTRDDYPASSGGTRPGTGSDYKRKPAASGSSRYDEDDYYPKPAVDSGEGRSTKPIDDYRPKPVDEVEVKPVSGGRLDDEYGSKIVSSGSYYPKPERDEYKPKPPVRDDYNTKPVIRDDYIPRPVDRDYDRKPVSRDEYVPKPVVRDEYVPKPADREEYYPKPAIRDDYNNPKPAVRDDYGNSKPTNRGYGFRPPVREDYNPKPVEPETREDYRPKPSSSNKDDDRKVSGSSYYPQPEDSGSRIDIGGYDDPKDEDYNDYKPAEDIKIGDDYNKPIPVANDGKCICVPYYQCKDGHIVTDGAGIIDARKRPEPDEDLPLDGKFQPPSCGPFHVCCNTPESSTVRPYEHRCGVRNPSGINSRILSPANKGEADFGEWPWQAAVLKSEGSVNIFQCGGVLIDKNHILTVAHCVFHLYKYNEYPLKVRLGEWDTQTTAEFLAHEDYKVSKIYIHPEYRNTSLWNDIAILRLEEPVLFAPHIDTVCLPKYDESFSGQNCVVTGWGKDSYKGGTFSNVMKEVALQVIDNYKCEEMLRKTRLGRFFQLHEGFVCAGGEHGLDSCKGDGGGPLVCYRKDRSYALAGLVSWGIDCGQPGVPGVYVKIQKYLDWISKNTGVSLQEYWPKT